MYDANANSIPFWNPPPILTLVHASHQTIDSMDLNKDGLDELVVTNTHTLAHAHMHACTHTLARTHRHTDTHTDTHTRKCAR